MHYQGNIWTVEVAGGALRQWTDKASGFPHWPGWSPDGRYLTYSLIAKAAAAPDSEWGARLIDTGDGSERALLHGASATLSASRIAWGKTGEVFVSVPLSVTIDGKGRVISELFVMRSDGTDYQRLTDLQGKARNPEFSPDESLLFFDLIPPPCVNTETLRETWVMTLGGSVQKWSTNLSDPTIAQSYPFSINQLAAKAISVGRDSSGAQGVIVAQNLDGSGRRLLTNWSVPGQGRYARR